MIFHWRYPIINTTQQHLFLTGLIILSLTHASIQATSFYVSSGGENSGNGTESHPFTTIQAAQEAVRAEKQNGMAEDITVYLRQGIHFLGHPLMFNADDGGTAMHRVTYTSYPDETARISGGMLITGEWVVEEGSVWKTVIPEVRDDSLWFRQLFINGRRAVRARYPDNDSILKIWEKEKINYYQNELTFSFSLDTIDFSKANAEVVAYHIWSSGRSYIDRWQGTTVYLKGPVGEIEGGGPRTTTQSRFYLEHAREFLTQPGEWYCERETGTLFFFAGSGENPNDAEIIAPVVETLLVIDGKPDEPVQNLCFENLVLEHCDWHFPEEGYQGLQAGHYCPFKGLFVGVIPLAVQLEYTKKCDFRECRIAHVGQTAIGFGRACTDNSVIGCEITDAGGTGIMVGWRQNMSPYGFRMNHDWPDPAMAPEGNIIRNNYIHHCGQVYFGALGIYTGFVKNTIVSHNYLSYLPYTGISVGLTWGSERTSMESCLTDSNHIHDVMQYLCDGGGIYAIGYQPGTTMLGNLIHDVWRRREAHGNTNNAFSLDERVRGFHVGYNTVYNISGNLLQFFRSSVDDNVVDTNYLFQTREQVPDSLLEHARSIAGLQPEYEYLLEPDHWGLNYPASIRSPGKGEAIPALVPHFPQENGPVLLFNAAGRRMHWYPNASRLSNRYISPMATGIYFHFSDLPHQQGIVKKTVRISEK